MKNNIKFLLKCILVLIPFIAAMLITALFPFGYMDSEYPAWKYTKDMSSGKITVNASDRESTIILGDSRAMADLMPEILDSAQDNTITYNLATGGATPIEMYYTLNRYIKRNMAPDNIIIMFAPFHYSIIDNYATRTEYFNFLTLKEWTELIDCARAAASETVLYDGYYDDMLSYRFRFPNKYLPALVNAKVFTRYYVNKNEYIDISNNRGYGQFGTSDGSDELNFETTYEKMHITGDAVLVQMYMNKLLRLCSDNNINTLVAIPPMNEASYNALKPSYIEDFTDYLSELAFQYTDVKIDKTIPHMDNKYFGDASHLNMSGAELFSKQFREKYY